MVFIFKITLSVLLALAIWHAMLVYKTTLIQAGVTLAGYWRRALAVSLVVLVFVVAFAVHSDIDLRARRAAYNKRVEQAMQAEREAFYDLHPETFNPRVTRYGRRQP